MDAQLNVTPMDIAHATGGYDEFGTMSWDSPVSDSYPNSWVRAGLPHDPTVISEHRTSPKVPNFAELRPNFGWAPEEIIRKTFKKTTWYARELIRPNGMRQHFKSRFPAANVRRRNEPVATDTVFSDVPAVDDGSKCAQLFVGTKSLVADVYGMKNRSGIHQHSGGPDSGAGSYGQAHQRPCPE